MTKKKYIKPLVSVILLDNSISLIMMTAAAHPTMPRPPKGQQGVTNDNSSFPSPFEKPFG